MSLFDDETRLIPLDVPQADSAAASFTGALSPAYNIGANPNGGYLLAVAGQALRLATPAQPDPLSITAHYLRPGLPGQACRIDTQVLRQGRTLSTVRATFAQEGGLFVGPAVEVHVVSGHARLLVPGCIRHEAGVHHLLRRQGV